MEISYRSSIIDPLSKRLDNIQKKLAIQEHDIHSIDITTKRSNHKLLAKLNNLTNPTINNKAIYHSIKVISEG